jgi:hypothetical protein
VEKYLIKKRKIKRHKYYLYCVFREKARTNEEGKTYLKKRNEGN